jgi:hypothetical protein
MFAPRDAGKEPPITNPKYLPLALATVAGEPISSNSARTVKASMG